MRTSPLHERDHQSRTTPEGDDPAPSSDQTVRLLAHAENPSLKGSPIRARYQAKVKPYIVDRITTPRIPGDFIPTHDRTQTKALCEELPRNLKGPTPNTAPVNRHG